jgi:hypothetical protein
LDLRWLKRDFQPDGSGEGLQPRSSKRLSGARGHDRSALGYPTTPRAGCNSRDLLPTLAKERRRGS